MKKSVIGNLEKHDFVKGAIMAFIAAILTGLYNGVDAGAFPSTWAEFKPILIVGIGSAISYLLKNFFTSSEDKFLTHEPKTKYEA